MEGERRLGGWGWEGWGGKEELSAKWIRCWTAGCVLGELRFLLYIHSSQHLPLSVLNCSDRVNDLFSFFRVLKSYLFCLVQSSCVAM